MATVTTRSVKMSAWMLAVAAMSSVQLGSAFTRSPQQLRPSSASPKQRVTSTRASSFLHSALLLLPILPFTLEMLALRRMTHTAFGTLCTVAKARRMH